MNSKSTLSPSWHFVATKIELAEDTESRVMSCRQPADNIENGEGGRKRVAVEFVCPDEYRRAFFRVEQSRVAALLSVGDPQADYLAQRVGLDAIDARVDVNANLYNLCAPLKGEQADTHHALPSNA